MFRPPDLRFLPYFKDRQKMSAEGAGTFQDAILEEGMASTAVSVLPENNKRNACISSPVLLSLRIYLTLPQSLL
jgi:hypothetical protein